MSIVLRAALPLLDAPVVYPRRRIESETAQKTPTEIVFGDIGPVAYTVDKLENQAFHDANQHLPPEEGISVFSTLQ